MAITLQLRPEVEAQLIGQAKVHGLPVDAYLGKLIEERVLNAPPDEEIEGAKIRVRLMELARQWHELPTLDHACADDIIEYDKFGLPTR